MSTTPDPQRRKWLKKMLILAFVIAVTGIVLLAIGIWQGNANTMFYGFAALTAAAVVGLGIMNRIFPRK